MHNLKKGGRVNLKMTKNITTNMTKFDDVKKKIENLVDEENCDKLKRKVKELYTFIETYPIKKATRKTYIDFYEVLGYDSEGNEIYGSKLGKISRESYEKNKEIIEKLRKDANIKELKKYLLH